MFLSRNKETKKKKKNNCNKKALFWRKLFGRLFDADENTVKWLLLFLFLLFSVSFTFCFVNISETVAKTVAEIKAIKVANGRNVKLARKIEKMTAGYPIEKMTRYLALQNEDVAAFMVAIAKKESNWGKRVPKLNGRDCYNYWGYREKRKRMGTGGHTCFDNPRDAVITVSQRLNKLMMMGFDTPKKLIVWKCGYSCAGHSLQSVQKWISDVDYYYRKF